MTYTNDQRFLARHLDNSDEWILKIVSVQTRDAGIYECQVSTEPKISQAYKLTVVSKYEIRSMCLTTQPPRLVRLYLTPINMCTVQLSDKIAISCPLVLLLVSVLPFICFAIHLNVCFFPVFYAVFPVCPLVTTLLFMCMFSNQNFDCSHVCTSVLLFCLFAIFP